MDYMDQDPVGALNTTVYGSQMAMPTPVNNVTVSPGAAARIYLDQKAAYDQMLEQRMQAGARAQQVAEQKYQEWNAAAGLRAKQREAQEAELDTKEQLRGLMLKNEKAKAEGEMYYNIVNTMSDVLDLPEEQQAQAFDLRKNYLIANGKVDPDMFTPEYDRESLRQGLDAMNSIAETWASLYGPDKSGTQRTKRLMADKKAEAEGDANTRDMEALLQEMGPEGGWNDDNVFGADGQLKPEFLRDYNRVISQKNRDFIRERMKQEGKSKSPLAYEQWLSTNSLQDSPQNQKRFKQLKGLEWQPKDDGPADEDKRLKNYRIIEKEIRERAHRAASSKVRAENGVIISPTGEMHFANADAAARYEKYKNESLRTDFANAKKNKLLPTDYATEYDDMVGAPGTGTGGKADSGFVWQGGKLVPK